MTSAVHPPADDSHTPHFAQNSATTETVGDKELVRTLDVSVVTPSLNMLDYLKRCHASIADQQGVKAEHIVMDGGSTDGTAEWLRDRRDVVARVEPDHGMYHAINKGLKISRGNILAYLNCDEQYLPGALSFVNGYFNTHPDIDVLVGDTLLIRPDGSLISFRKSRPLPSTIIKGDHIQIQSSSLFFRRTIIDNGDYFDDRYRHLGDHDFILRLMSKKYRFAFCGVYLSAFTMTGFNFGRHEHIASEVRQLRQETPVWIVKLSRLLKLVRWGLKLSRGAYFQRMPLKYAVYDGWDTGQRRIFIAHKASFRWRRK